MGGQGRGRGREAQFQPRRIESKKSARGLGACGAGGAGSAPSDFGNGVAGGCAGTTRTAAPSLAAWSRRNRRADSVPAEQGVRAARRPISETELRVVAPAPRALRRLASPHGVEEIGVRLRRPDLVEQELHRREVRPGLGGAARGGGQGRGREAQFQPRRMESKKSARGLGACGAGGAGSAPSDFGNGVAGGCAGTTRTAAPSLAASSRRNRSSTSSPGSCRAGTPSPRGRPSDRGACAGSRSSGGTPASPAVPRGGCRSG